MEIAKIAASGARLLAKLRRETPLVQIITNYVTVNEVANSLLALGASPAMVEAKREAGAFAKLARALYLNLGTLTAEQSQAIPRALKEAKRRGLPVVLDPVACGAFKEKMRSTQGLIKQGGIGLIKGNQGEILSLAGIAGHSRGVDALETAADCGSATRLVAKKFSCLVVATGKLDYLSDGARVWRLAGGDELLTRVSGTGCLLGGLIAAFWAVEVESGLVGALAAAASLKLAAEKAVAEPRTSGPGSFRVALLDQLALLKPEELQAKLESSLSAYEPAPSPREAKP